MILLATIQRSQSRSDGMPYMEHRTFDPTTNEWGWSDKLIDAYIFPNWELAEDHIKLLKLQGEKRFIAPFVHSKSEQEKREVLIKYKSKSPSEVFDELEKRGLA